MSTSPLVSIVVPLVTADERIGDALDSCTMQTLAEIEIICVDISGGSAIVPHANAADPRLRVIPQTSHTSVPDARRAGAMAAAAPYVLHLDPGDELDSAVAARAYQTANDADADIVEIGVSVVDTGGGRDDTPRPRALNTAVLRDENIIRSLFPDDQAVDVTLSRFLFRTGLLRAIYAAFPDGYEAHELSVVFLACAAADTYASTSAPLYRRSASGEVPRRITDPASDFQLSIDMIDAVSVIGPVVTKWARHSPNPEPLLDGYESLRLAKIAAALHLLQHDPEDSYERHLAVLRARASDIDIITAAATFAPAILQSLAQRGDRIELGEKPVRNVLLTTNTLTTGGVSGVLLVQARLLLNAGYGVIIAVHRRGSDETLVPDGATLVEVSGPTKRSRLAQWAELCSLNDIDVVIDHRILYSRDWPGYALAARASRAATIGWIHNFAARPTYNGNDLHSLMHDHLNVLAQLVVLSPLDVAFWKLRGIQHVTYLPNPPSPLLLASAGHAAPKTAPRDRRLEAVWWGRLEEHTKKVTQLIEVAAALKRMGVDFRLRIIGPDWADMTMGQLSKMAAARGVGEFVEAIGPRRGQDLLEAIDSSDIFINTSIIEGYPLTLAEAQARGLPIAMYDLPWLVLTRNNPGVITVPQGDAGALASEIAKLANDPRRYEAMSRASIKAAADASSHDFPVLYEQLLSGALPDEYSPEPTLRDGQELLDLLIFFTEASPTRSLQPSARRGAPAAGSEGDRKPSQPRTPGARVERKLTPLAHRVLSAAPVLRPVARRVKLILLRR